MTEARIGRPPTCECGACQKCRARVRGCKAWQALSMEERRAIIARRNPRLTQAADRARYLRHRTARITAMRAYAAAHPRPASPEPDPLKRSARVTFGNAVRDGKITRQPCVKCGDPCSHGHHEDYSKPLDVVWLCRMHHGERHREINEARRRVAS